MNTHRWIEFGVAAALSVAIGLLSRRMSLIVRRLDAWDKTADNLKESVGSLTGMIAKVNDSVEAVGKRQDVANLARLKLEATVDRWDCLMSLAAGDEVEESETIAVAARVPEPSRFPDLDTQAKRETWVRQERARHDAAQREI